MLLLWRTFLRELFGTFNPVRSISMSKPITKKRAEVAATGVYPVWFIHCLTDETRLKMMEEFEIPPAADFDSVWCRHFFSGKSKRDRLHLVRVLKDKVQKILSKYPSMDGYVFFRQHAPHEDAIQ